MSRIRCHRKRRSVVTRAAALTAAPALLAAIGSTNLARAASQYWDANGNLTGATPGGSGVAPGTWGVDSFWNDLADGTGNSNPWTDGNVAVFSAGSDATGAFSVTVSGTQSPGQMVFEEGNVSLSGGQISLGANGVDTAVGLTDIIGSTLTGSQGLAKTGAGVLALTGTNTYTGGTNVSGGTLSILDDTNLGDAANSISFSNNATLRTDGNLTSARAISLGALGGAINTNGFAVTLSGNITGVGGLTKSSTGTLFLTGTNTYSGVTAFNGGTVEAGPNNLGDGSGTNTFAFGGGTLRTAASFNTARNMAMNGTGTVNTNGLDSTFGGLISGTGNFSKSGNGTLSLTANNSGYTGTINVQAGTLRATDSGVFGVAGTANTSNVQVSSGATLDVADNVNVPDRVFLSGTGVNGNGAIHYAGNGTATFSGGITLNTNGARIQSDSGTLVLSTGSVFGSGLDINFGGAGNITTTASPSNLNISTSGGHVVKDGSGTLTLGGNSAFSGGVIVNGGVVSVGADITTNGNSANLGQYPATFKPDAVVLNGATLRSTNGTSASNFVSPNRGIQLSAAGGSLDVSTSGIVLLYHSNTSDNTGGIIGLTGGATTATLTKVGAGELRVQGAGTASFGFTQLVVKNGLYRIGHASSGTESVETGFGAAPATPTNDAIVLDGGAIGSSLSLNLNDNRGITVTANGGTINGAAPATITMPASSQAKLTGSGPLTITGTTSNGFILNAPLSDYSGALTVNGLLNIGSQVNLSVASLGGNSTGRLGVNGQLTFGSDNTSTTFSGAVTAAAATGVVTKTGSGTLTINTNPWANPGPTNINAGAIKYGDASTGLGDNSLVTVAGGATLVMGNNADTIGSLAGAGSVLNGGNVTVTGNNASPATYSGNYAGAGSLTKNGSGTQNLAGSNGFSAVNVAGGVLGVQSNGAIGAGTAPLNLTAGTVAFLPTGTGTIAAKVATLTIAPGATVDLADDKLITTTGVGTVTGGTYDGVSGMIQSGRNGGNWSGSGIVTSLANGSFTTVGVATAQQVKGLVNPTDTALFAGRTVTGSDTLVMYTYGGDANLDGKINVDDYGRIDSSISLGIAGWYNGDFNYDGKINVDDYGIIDSNIGIQGAPFFTAGSSVAILSGVSAVPEPATLGSIALLAAATFGRRRRRSR